MIHELLFCISLFIVFYGRIFIHPFSHLAKCVLKLEHGCCSVPNKQVSQCGAERRWQEVCSRYSGAAAGLGVPFSLSLSLFPGHINKAKAALSKNTWGGGNFLCFFFLLVPTHLHCCVSNWQWTFATWGKSLLCGFIMWLLFKIKCKIKRKKRNKKRCGQSQSRSKKKKKANSHVFCIKKIKKRGEKCKNLLEDEKRLCGKRIIYILIRGIQYTNIICICVG